MNTTDPTVHVGANLTAARRTTGIIQDETVGLAIAEFELPDEYGWERDSAVVNTLAGQAAPDIHTWVQTHTVDEVQAMIRRAYSVRSEHMMRAENAGQLEDILRARLREASATEQPPAPLSLIHI